MSARDVVLVAAAVVAAVDVLLHRSLVAAAVGLIAVALLL
jgi:hypothetical protein